MQTMLSNEAIGSFFNHYRLAIADSQELVEKSYRLRYQVYCLERNFLAGEDGTECDEFDEYSHHTLLVDRASNEVLGSARLIVGSRWRSDTSFPMQALGNSTLPSGLRADTTGEVSRFAISKVRRSPRSTALMRLALVRGLVTLSSRLGITHWCAVMEPSLLRLLQATSIIFENFGPPVQHHGLRQPCYNSVSAILDQVAEHRPQLWQFLTANGTLWRPHTAPITA